VGAIDNDDCEMSWFEVAPGDAGGSGGAGGASGAGGEGGYVEGVLAAVCVTPVYEPPAPGTIVYVADRAEEYCVQQTFELRGQDNELLFFYGNLAVGSLGQRDVEELEILNEEPLCTETAGDASFVQRLELDVRLSGETGTLRAGQSLRLGDFSMLLIDAFSFDLCESVGECDSNRRYEFVLRRD
jgi:hypothetical protein